MNNTTFAVIAVVSALAMFGVVMVTVAVAVSMQLQEAEAAKPPIAECATFWKNWNASIICRQLLT